MERTPQDLIRQLRSEFLGQLGRRLETIARSWHSVPVGREASTELRHLETLVHKLRGAAGTYGLATLSEMSTPLEAEIRAAAESTGALSPSRHAAIDGLVRALLDEGRVVSDESQRFEIPRLDVPTDASSEVVFVLEPDNGLARLLSAEISRHGRRRRLFATLEELMDALASTSPIAVLVNAIGLGGDGSAILREILSAIDRTVPVLFLSPVGDLQTRLAAIRDGAEVYFTRPAGVGALLANLDLLAGAPELPYRTLIVDDDEFVARHCSLVLEASGMVCQAVVDSGEVLRAVSDFSPDVILLDLHMPDCSGAELAAVLRQERTALATPIVFLSSERDEVVQQRALSMGGDAFLTKPMAEKRLIAVAYSWARRSRFLKAAMTATDLSEGPGTPTDDRATEYEQEMRLARDTQRRMLPRTPDLKGFEVEVLYQPCSEIGGDFYDFIDLGEDRLGIVIGDVTGHGVTAALIVGMCKKILQMTARSSESLVETVHRANEEIIGELDKKTFVTILYGILDLNESTFRFVRAGHEPIVLVRPGRPSTCQRFQPAGTALGILGGDRYRRLLEEEEISLRPGDLIFLHTDGLLEAADPKGQMYGNDRLEATLLGVDPITPETVTRAVHRSVSAHNTEESMADDLTFVVFQHVGDEESRSIPDGS